MDVADEVLVLTCRLLILADEDNANVDDETLRILTKDDEEDIMVVCTLKVVC